MCVLYFVGGQTETPTRDFLQLGGPADHPAQCAFEGPERPVIGDDFLTCCGLISKLLSLEQIRIVGFPIVVSGDNY